MRLYVEYLDHAGRKHEVVGYGGEVTVPAGVTVLHCVPLPDPPPPEPTVTISLGDDGSVMRRPVDSTE